MIMTIDDTGVMLRATDFASFGHLADDIEATEEDIRQYAGQSSLGLADRILLVLLKRVPQ